MPVSTDVNKMTVAQTDFPGAVLFESGTVSALYTVAASDTPLMYFIESGERYAGLDLNYYRQVMTSHDFKVYLDFIGEEDVGFLPEDFEVYYPEDEE